MKKLSMLAVGILLVMFTLGGIAYGGHGQVNVNTATVEELHMLDGITEEIAISIIEFRNVNGPFASVNDLLKVEGMSEAKLRDIRNFVKLEGMTDYRLTEIMPKSGHAPESRQE
jgi:competence ComEA-like helix-hairpin-helix protein